MDVVEHVSTAGLDMQVVGVGVGAGVGTPAGTALTAPLVSLPDDELDVAMLPVGEVAGQRVTSSTIGGPPVNGTSTRMDAPGRLRTANATTVEATKAAPATICQV